MGSATVTGALPQGMVSGELFRGQGTAMDSSFVAFSEPQKFFVQSSTVELILRFTKIVSYEVDFRSLSELTLSHTLA